MRTPHADYPRPHPHRDIIERWGTFAELARDLRGLGYQISDMGVVRWGHRPSGIPNFWFVPVAAAAKARGFSDITVNLLAERVSLWPANDSRHLQEKETA